MFGGMATRAEHDVPDDGEATEPGYAAWKQAKIERGLEQPRDRSAMIPVEQVWRDLKLER
jgi:hypothetical protein